MLLRQAAFCQTAPAAGPCSIAQLKHATKGVEGGLSHGAEALEVTNISQRACSLEGVPILHFLDKNGAQQQVSVLANQGDYLFGPVPSKRIVLRSGDSAFFLFGHTTGDEMSDGSRLPCRTTNELRLTLPGSKSFLVFFKTISKKSGGMELLTCGSVDVSAWRLGRFSDSMNLH